MRDNLKDELYFEKVDKRMISNIENHIKALKDGTVAEMMLSYAHNQIILSSLSYVESAYSSGKDIKEVKRRFYLSLEYFNEFWKREYVIDHDRKGNEILEYILYQYPKMLKYVSLGYLLNITEDAFKIIIDKLDYDGVKDNLIEFILRAKFPHREKPENETYVRYAFPKIFKDIRAAIETSEMRKSEEYLKSYITYYKRTLNNLDIYTSHLPEYHDLYHYSGYWSFESAAVVKAMNLDDTSFRQKPHYPRDLVDTSLP